MSTFSYAEAVKLLGARESKLVNALDKILSGALLGGSALDLFGLIGWFDAKSDFIRLCHEFVTKAAEKRTGLSRYDRTQRLHAAHAVIVLTAFFEAFDELDIPVNSRELELTRERQVVLAKAGPWLSGLANLSLPLAIPERSHEENLKFVRSYYQRLAEELADLVRGLAVWDRLTETEQGRLAAALGETLAEVAGRRYQELLGRLAVDCPEFGFWLSLRDGQATRGAVREVDKALAEVERLLGSLALGNTPQEYRAELARTYRAVLNHPIINPDEVPDGLTIPLLADCYIDPRFQACEVDATCTPAQTSWWDNTDARDDVHRFLTGYLTSPKAVRKPLLVLGDPGSGKSVLTKVLAARLPATDFMVVRVELRTVPTEADLVEQIEHGLRAALHEQVSWGRLARTAPPALPVVLLDGFDELLQATGVSQTGYLTRIAQFQRESVDRGHPVAVVVTSRISVADRATIPDDATVMRLLPFDEQQVARWLEAWNAANGSFFAANGLSSLSVETAMTYPALAEQPLLLLMLALYDADGNALQRNRDTIGEAELYERLLTRFARREVVKDQVDRTEDALREDIKDELERLSVVAFAMFNRGTQWVTEHDLDQDLGALLNVQPDRTGTRTPLGAGEAVLGRFFFIQRAEAVRDEKTLRTYEFLHATFGEFLVARHIWRILGDILQVEQSKPRRMRVEAPDDSELRALLSFAPLCSRTPVVTFLQELANATAPERRDALGSLVGQLFQLAEQPRHEDRFTRYEPVELTPSTRSATYRVNLVLLAVVVRGELLGSELFGDELFGDADDVVDRWRREALHWKSRIAHWWTLVNLLHLERLWHEGQRDIRLRITSAPEPVPPVDVVWATGLHREKWPRGERIHLITSDRELHFLCDRHADLLRHEVEPLSDRMRAVVQVAEGNWVTDNHVVSRLLAAADADERRSWYPGAVAQLAAILEYWNGPAKRLATFVADLVCTDPAVDEGLLEELMTGAGSLVWAGVCRRLGLGGDDIVLLDILARHWDVERALESIPDVVVDAWLRLHERGHVFAPAAGCPDLADVIRGVDLLALAATRPDLIKRARTAMSELDQEQLISWP